MNTPQASSSSKKMDLSSPTIQVSTQSYLTTLV